MFSSLKKGVKIHTSKIYTFLKKNKRTIKEKK